MSDETRAIYHMPTPGDHYSSSTGSAVMTVIYELNKCHEALGHPCYVLIGRNTTHDYPVGKCLLTDLNPPPGKAQKALDFAMSRLGFARPFARNFSAPLVGQIPSDTCGYVFVHNQPAIVQDIRRKAPKSKIVLYCHNELFALYSDREVQRIADTADHIICVSEFTASSFNRRLGPSGTRAVGIINGVDCQRFAPSDNRPANTIPVILFVARVVPEKGADILLKAARELVENGYSFRLKLVGSSNFNASDPLTGYERQLRELAEPIADSVEFVPFRDRAAVLDEYRQADIFCAPSNWDEPCSLTVSEAMAAGLPAVVSSRGGIPEVGKDAVLYFKPPDHHELAGQLARLLSSEPLREEYRGLGLSRSAEIGWQAQYAKLMEALCI